MPYTHCTEGELRSVAEGRERKMAEELNRVTALLLNLCDRCERVMKTSNIGRRFLLVDPTLAKWREEHKKRDDERRDDEMKVVIEAQLRLWYADDFKSVTFSKNKDPGVRYSLFIEGNVFRTECHEVNNDTWKGVLMQCTEKYLAWLK